MEVRRKTPLWDVHRQLGALMWENVGMARSKQSLEAAISRIQELRSEFWASVNVPGTDANLNVALERANRVADFMEFGELLARDALLREESCGGHFREEFQTPDGEAMRNDDEYSYAAAWEFAGADKKPILNKEPLNFDYVHPSQRSYK